MIADHFQMYPEKQHIFQDIFPYSMPLVVNVFPDSLQKKKKNLFPYLKLAWGVSFIIDVRVICINNTFTRVNVTIMWWITQLKFQESEN